MIVRSGVFIKSLMNIRTKTKRVAFAALLFFMRDLNRREQTTFSPTWACSCDSSVANPAIPTTFKPLIHKALNYVSAVFTLPEAYQKQKIMRDILLGLLIFIAITNII